MKTRIVIGDVPGLPKETFLEIGSCNPIYLDEDDRKWLYMELAKRGDRALLNVVEKAQVVVDALNVQAGPWLINNARCELRDALAALKLKE